MKKEDEEIITMGLIGGVCALVLVFMLVGGPLNLRVDPDTGTVSSKYIPAITEMS